MMHEMHYEDLVVQLINEGNISAPRGQECKELLNQHIIVPNNECLMDIPGIRTVKDITTGPGKYLVSEFVWYMSGALSVEFIGNFASLWKHICDDQNEINSNYGFQVFHKPLDVVNKTVRSIGSSPFMWVYNELRKDKDSRRAVIHYTWENMFRIKNIKDFVCTQLQQFFIRDNILTSTVYIRSSDIIRGLTFDIPWWSFVQQLLVTILKDRYPGLKCGNLDIFIGSSHVYEPHYELLNKLSEHHNYMKPMILKDLITLQSNMDNLGETRTDNIGWYKAANINKDLEEFLDEYSKKMTSSIYYYRGFEDWLDNTDVVKSIADNSLSIMRYYYRIKRHSNYRSEFDKDLNRIFVNEMKHFMSSIVDLEPKGE